MFIFDIFIWFNNIFFVVIGIILFFFLDGVYFDWCGGVIIESIVLCFFIGFICYIKGVYCFNCIYDIGGNIGIIFVYVVMEIIVLD